MSNFIKIRLNYVYFQIFDYCKFRKCSDKKELFVPHKFSMEKYVFHFLLKGSHPIFVALARGMKKKPDPEWLELLENGRLLIVTPFDEAVTRVSSATASRRNQFMIEMADEVVVGYAGAGGNLEKLLRTINKSWKMI